MTWSSFPWIWLKWQKKTWISTEIPLVYPTVSWLQLANESASKLLLSLENASDFERIRPESLIYQTWSPRNLGYFNQTRLKASVLLTEDTSKTRFSDEVATKSQFSSRNTAPHKYLHRILERLSNACKKCKKPALTAIRHKKRSYF